MKYTVKGFGDIDLGSKNFVAKGGEGSVYVKGSTAYKIYEDASNMIPEAKIKELSVLDMPQIIKPESLILDKKNKPIGYTMRYVKDTTPLARLFTKTFKQKNNILPEDAIELTKKLQDIMTFTHSKDTLIVDVNEMNFLANKDLSDFYAIDVNTYQTKHYPATAIMQSVRDLHSVEFTEESDWFSWAIITFQLLTGIHPYKGNHPDFASMPIADRLEARMLKNISVFNQDTKVPKVVMPFDVIPASLKSWYKAVFEDGHRSVPPVDYKTMVQLITKVREITGGDAFDINLLEAYVGNILEVFCTGNVRVVQTDHTVYYKGYEIPLQTAKIGFTPKMSYPIAAYLDDKNLKLYNLETLQDVPINIHADGIIESDGRLYIKNKADIVELVFTEVGKNVIPSVQIIGQVVETSKIFDGMIFQNMLGRFVASIFPESKKHYQIAIPELDGYRLIDAKYQNNVLVAVGMTANGEYDRFTIRFSSDRTKYDLRKTENIAYTGINFAVADHGVCVLMNEEEKIEAFSNIRNVSEMKVIDDPAVGADMKLFKDGSSILFAQDNKLFSIKMK
ncbi:MAG: hypothetical protein ACW99G_01380 [Candidatus Thorarchaeota archaeon]|jgi:hypothetical protein